MKLSYFVFVSLSIALSSVTAADEAQLQPPTPASDGNIVAPDLNLFMTDFAAIEATANQVDQTSSVDPTALPDQQPAATEVTAIDGELTDAGTASSKKRSTSTQGLQTRFNKGNIVSLKSEERGINDYIKVFDASTSPKDASIQGTAYLTYKLVSNSTTYNNGLNECLSFCDSVAGCRFANLYYEFNNALYDWVFSEKSNLACALYGDVHTAAEKTNFGGQQLESFPHDLTYITRSTGWAKEAPFAPPTPAGYALSFGPINQAVSQGSSLAFVTLSNYDVAACANVCNERAADPVLGTCQSFNIWRTLVDRLPTTYVCQLYAAPVELSRATYSGTGNQEVTLSRGYNRINSLPYGRNLNSFDWLTTGSYSGFIGGGYYSHLAAPAFYNGYIALDRLYNPSAPLRPGSISNRVGLNTIPGKRYTLQFWYSQYEETIGNDLIIKWNGATVYNTRNQGLVNYALKPVTVSVIAQGNDRFEVGPGAMLGYQYISDFTLYLSS